MEAQTASKSLGSPRSHFLTLCKVLIFFMSFWDSENLAKIIKFRDFGRQSENGHLVLEVSAGEATCQGGERGGVIEN